MSRLCILFVIICVNNFVTSENAITVGREFIKSGIIPDVISVEPLGPMIVQHSGLRRISLGNIMTPRQVKDIPWVTWENDPDKYYTVMMIDPDAPSREDPKFREWLHWLVVNVPGDNIDAGEVFAEYIGAGPGRGSGLHRYVFLVYEQPGKIVCHEPVLHNRSMAHRTSFSATIFAYTYNLGPLVAGNFYQAEWDDYVPCLYEQIGATPPKGACSRRISSMNGAERSTLSSNIIVVISAIMSIITLRK